MLETLDMKAKTGRAAYGAERDALEVRIGALQRRAFQAGVPVVILFEGFDAAGKGTVISILLQALDPRCFRVWVTKPRTEDEALHPFLWRFWNRTPARGRFAIFDGGWYMEPSEALAGGRPDRESVTHRLADIRSFERQLADDGAVVIKFFLHISKKEQKKRFERLSADPSTAWRVTKEDRRRHRNYARYLAAAEELLKESDDPWARWTPVAAHDRRHAALTVLRTVARALETRLAAGAAPARKAQIPLRKTQVLKALNMKRSISRGEYNAALERRRKTLRRLEYRIYMERIPVVIVFEGWDAAGKGGCIKRLTRRLDPRGYAVAPFAAPTPEEKSRHYLWRFWREMPKAGHITIFDRSWYGRVLVEVAVHGVSFLADPPAACGTV
jgi:polyphosphate kinase 2 (PPK2 family)